MRPWPATSARPAWAGLVALLAGCPLGLDAPPDGGASADARAHLDAGALADARPGLDAERADAEPTDATRGDDGTLARDGGGRDASPLDVGPPDAGPAPCPECTARDGNGVCRPTPDAPCGPTIDCADYVHSVRPRGEFVDCTRGTGSARLRCVVTNGTPSCGRLDVRDCADGVAITTCSVDCAYDNVCPVGQLVPADTTVLEGAFCVRSSDPSTAIDGPGCQVFTECGAFGDGQPAVVTRGCTSKGTCGEALRGCGPYACDETFIDCRTSCSDPSECAPSNTCYVVSNICGP